MVAPRRFPIVGLGLSLVVLGMVGCAGTPRPSELLSVYPSLPLPSYPDPRPSLRAARPLVSWGHDGRGVAVVTHGDTTCPNTPENVVVKDSTHVVIRFVRIAVSQNCSDDITVNTAIVRLPASVSRDRPVAVDLGYQGKAVLTPERR